MTESFLNENSLLISDISLNNTTDYEDINKKNFFAKFQESINELNKDDLNKIYSELTLIHDKLAVSFYLI